MVGIGGGCWSCGYGEDMGGRGMDWVMFVVRWIGGMWGEKEWVMCGGDVLVEVWEGRCLED